eukprot:1146847-Pelagomonas_calceolata.AAC.6
MPRCASSLGPTPWETLQKGAFMLNCRGLLTCLSSEGCLHFQLLSGVYVLNCCGELAFTFIQLMSAYEDDAHEKKEEEEHEEDNGVLEILLTEVELAFVDRS